MIADRLSNLGFPRIAWCKGFSIPPVWDWRCLEDSAGFINLLAILADVGDKYMLPLLACRRSYSASNSLVANFRVAAFSRMVRTCCSVNPSAAIASTESEIES